MDYKKLVVESKVDQEQPILGLQSFYEVCHQVVDGQEAQGRSYELAGLLVVLVLAKLPRMQSLFGATDWIRDQEALLLEGLYLSWKRTSCTITYSYELARLASQQVNTAWRSGRCTKRKKAKLERNQVV